MRKRLHIISFILIMITPAAYSWLPQTFNESKWATLNPPESNFSREGKGHRSISVEITPLKTLIAGQPFILRGRAQVARSFEDLRWDWVLTPGIRVVSGQIHGEKSHLSEGESLETEITLMSDKNEDRLIHFHVYEIRHNEAMGDIAHFSTGLKKGTLQADILQQHQRIRLIQ